MKYSIIIFLLVILSSCHPNQKLYKLYILDDSHGLIRNKRIEMLDTQTNGILKGKIFEQSSKKKVIGATIILHNKKELFGTVSDSNGCFHIKNIPNESYRLIISIIGYHSYIDTISISAYECMSLTIDLIESPMIIGEK